MHSVRKLAIEIYDVSCLDKSMHELASVSPWFNYLHSSTVYICMYIFVPSWLTKIYFWKKRIIIFFAIYII